MSDPRAEPDHDEADSDRVSSAARALRNDELLGAVRGLEGRVDAVRSGVKLELAGVREDIEKVRELCQGIAATVGRIDSERETMRAAVRELQAGRRRALEDDGADARRSASNLDAQALQSSIEHVDAQHRGDVAAIVARLGRVEKVVGAEPDPVLKIDGSGLAADVARFRSARQLAVVAIGSCIAGGSAVAAALKFLGGL
jgi:hypothetical protein